jgi:hypothetical protein
MNTNIHLIELERELEADLADARRHIELGRRNAIDQLNSHRESLGERCGEAALKIDLLAADAEQELKNVRTRLGELNLLLAVEEVRDLATFDQFRDRILEAMADAEQDLGALDQSGSEWAAREKNISEAWAALSRQLGVARKHLVHESELARHEFVAEREELAAHLDEGREGHDAESRGELFARVGEQLKGFLPGLKTVFLRDDAMVPRKHRGARHD